MFTITELRLALERWAVDLGYVDPVYVTQFRAEIRAIAKVLRKELGYRGAQFRMVRDEGYADIRQHWGFGDLIAKIKVNGSESLPREAEIISSTELSGAVKDVFIRVFKPKVKVRFNPTWPPD